MRNILLITADQWRGDCLGAAGHPVVKTPHLDALAEQGLRFDRHFAGAAPCSPARACLYTGLYQMNNRVCRNGTPLDQRHDTLGKAMSRAGYEPVLFGYTDQSIDPRTTDAGDPRLRSYEGVLPGFERRLGWSGTELPWLSWLERQGYDNALQDVLDKRIHFPSSGATDPPTQEPPRYRAEHTQTAYLTDEVIRWLHEQTHCPDERPGWFAHVSYQRPHPPFAVPEPYSHMFSPDAVPAFAGEAKVADVAAQHPYLDYELSHLRKNLFLPGVDGLVRDWDETALRTIAALYYGMVAEVDAQLGRLFDSLKKFGYWDNTLVIFTSDHGEQLGDHRLLGKFGFYDQSFHIPLIIRDPLAASTAGQVVHRFTESVDVMPTIVQAAGQRVPAHLDGRSLLVFLQDDNVDQWRASAHWEFDFREVISQRAEQALHLPSQLCNLAVIRDEKYKYVHFAGLPPLLFDLQRDPEEQHNVAEHESYQSVRLYLSEKLLRWRAEHLDQTMALTQLGEQGPAAFHGQR